MAGLILSRRVGESVQIGEDITVTVVNIDGGRGKISFEAPENESVMRTELLERDAWRGMCSDDTGSH